MRSLVSPVLMPSPSLTWKPSSGKMTLLIISGRGVLICSDVESTLASCKERELREKMASMSCDFRSFSGVRRNAWHQESIARAENPSVIVACLHLGKMVRPYGSSLSWSYNSWSFFSLVKRSPLEFLQRWANDSSNCNINSLCKRFKEDITPFSHKRRISLTSSSDCSMEDHTETISPTVSPAWMLILYSSRTLDITLMCNCFSRNLCSCSKLGLRRLK